MEQKEKPKSKNYNKILYAKGIRISTLSILMILLAFAILLLFCHMSFNTVNRYYEDSDMGRVITEGQIRIVNIFDKISTQDVCVRKFVNTCNRDALNTYFEEDKNITDAFNEMFESYRLMNKPEVNLYEIIDLYETKKETELYAMRLAAAAYDIDEASLPIGLVSVDLKKEDREAGRKKKLQTAKEMLYDSDYLDLQENLRSSVSAYTITLVRTDKSNREQSDKDLTELLYEQGYMNVALFFLIVLFNLLTYFMIIRPMRKAVKNIDSKEKLPIIGSVEMKFLAVSYNEMYEANAQRQQSLMEKATHDALTGLYNRAVFDDLCREAASQRMKDRVMVMMDINGFKKINDTHGHDVGDLALKKVAAFLSHYFDPVGHVCRVGGDEFAVMITDTEMLDLDVLTKRLKTFFKDLAVPTPGLPALSVSVGIAQGENEGENYDLYKHADTALYQAKEKSLSGESGICVFEV